MMERFNIYCEAWHKSSTLYEQIPGFQC